MTAPEVAGEGPRGVSAKHTFHGLNLMRGVAAIAVVAFHAHVLFGRQLVPGGYLAVDLFFLMSGFVIAHAYDGKLRDGLGVGSFTVMRLIRFAPFYYVGVMIGLGLELLLSATGSSSALANQDLAWALVLGLLFLPFARVGHDMFPLNVPAWSLHHELVVNVAYAVLHRWLTTRVLAGIGVVFALILVPGVLLMGSAAVGPLTEHYPLALSRAVFSFTVGVIVYRVRPCAVVNPTVALVLATALLFVDVTGVGRAVFDAACILIVFPVLLPSLVAFEPRTGRVQTLSKWFGDLSYGLYALHYPLIWLVRGAGEKFGVNLAVAGGLLIVGLACSCGLLETRVELPLRRRLTRLLTPPSRSTRG